MKTLFVSAVCFGLTALAGAAAGGDKAAAKLEGTWIGTGAIQGGKKLPAADIERNMLTVVFKDGKYSMHAVRGGRAVEIEAGTYKADPSKKPATLDFTIGKGRKDEGKKLLGIYQLDGDTLTVAFADIGKDRPKNLEGELGTEVTILKRKK
jgi:uncharacterized protein (TIGR03067 family)